MNSIIAELETAENNLPHRPFYCHVCVSPPSRRPSDRTERSGRIKTTVQYLAEGGMILLCVLDFFTSWCFSQNSVEIRWNSSSSVCTVGAVMWQKKEVLFFNKKTFKFKLTLFDWISSSAQGKYVASILEHSNK